jgi:hypothetical protein
LAALVEHPLLDHLVRPQQEHDGALIARFEQ